MKERPILFSAPMVRALLDGSKTQTRRVMKYQPDDHHWKIFPEYELKRSQMVTIGGNVAVRFSHHIPHNPAADMEPRWNVCPYGEPSDRLWVREAHAFSVCDPEGRHWTEDPENWDVIYRADPNQPSGGWRDAEGNVIKAPWRPSTHMPRWASRIDLEITGVRVERLQDISEGDAIAEGLQLMTRPREWGGDTLYSYEGFGEWVSTARAAYRALWEQINGAGSWTINPWVWVVEFRQAAAVAGPIGAPDALLELANAEAMP